jgi:RNA polymerase sigma-70 factor, ECF subfamily
MSAAAQRLIPPGPEVSDDDAAVIGRSLRDPEAFAVLFDRHAPYIHRYVARRLGRDVADDLVAETFLTAFRKRGGYELSRADARPWLYGIATNLVGTHRRDSMRSLRLVARPDELVEPFPEERIGDRLSAQARRPELAAALATLAPGDRDVLLLIAWEQLNYEEVARALDIPLGTVRSRLHRARRLVRTALGADPDDLGARS